MKPFVTITFPQSGRIYAVSSAVIVEDRVKARQQVGLNETVEQIRAEVTEDFGDDFKMFDWAKNNMNWSDIEPYACLVGVMPRDVYQDWDAATLETVDAPPKPREVTADTIMSNPLEATMVSMMAEGQHASIAAISGPAGERMGAVAVFQGPAEVIDGYLAVLNQFGEFLERQAALSAQASGSSDETPVQH